MNKNEITLTELTESKFRNYYERLWEENFELLKAFRKTNDYQPSEKENYKLNRWLHNQKLKAVKGLLSKNKIKKLESLHFKGNFNDKIWDRNFDLLKEYRKTHKWAITKKENKQLYSWLQVAKTKKKNKLLSEDRVKKLESLKFNENYNDKIWDKKFNLLKEYRNHHDFKPSGKENKKLYYWLERQKVMLRKGLLSDERISKLESLHFKGNQIDKKWYKNFELLKKYWKNNEFTPTIKENKALTIWLRIQKAKRKKGLLSDDKISKLESLHFKGNQIDKKWYNHFELLKKYRQKNEFAPTAKENKDLSLWLQRQKVKQKKGLLPDEKIKQLKPLQFKGNYHDKVWAENYDLLKDFRQKNPLRWPKQRSNEPIEHKLAVWCLTIRTCYRKNKLTKQRFEKLKAINFPFET